MDFLNMVTNIKEGEQYLCLERNECAIMRKDGLRWSGGKHVRVTLDVLSSTWIDAPLRHATYEDAITACKNNEFAAVVEPESATKWAVRLNNDGALVFKNNGEPVMHRSGQAWYIKGT